MKKLALKIIESEFYDKTDKGGKPYTHHLVRVMENSRNHYNGDVLFLQELETVALLHDLLEDCPAWTTQHIKTIFNDSVASSVNRLTKKEGQGYDAYISNINNDPIARAVKLADLRDNMDITRLEQITEKDIERLKKYHKAYVYLKGN